MQFSNLSGNARSCKLFLINSNVLVTEIHTCLSFNTRHKLRVGWFIPKGYQVGEFFGWGTARGVLLSVPEGNTAFRQIVRRQFQGDLIAGKDADAIATQAAGQVSQHNSLVLQLNAEQAARKFLQDRAGYFNTVLFAHRPPG